MKDLKEESSQLGYGNQWAETTEQTAALCGPQPVSLTAHRCKTPGCDGEVSPLFHDAGLCSRCGSWQHRVQRNEATIPECYAWCDFDSPDIAGRCGGELMLKKASTALLALKEGKAPTVVLQGPAGSGKTVTACAMLRRWISRAPGIFVDALDIGRCYRNTPLGEEPSAMQEAKRSKLIVLDDVGGEPPTGNDAVGDLIHARHASGKPTIITLGFDREELARKYGAGITRRIYDRAIVVAWPEAARKAA